jgi:hypothetical protein
MRLVSPAQQKKSCNPCGGTPAVELTEAESVSVYDCLLKETMAVYGHSKNPIVKDHTNFWRYSKVTYQSAIHGNRFVQNYANNYGKTTVRMKI